MAEIRVNATGGLKLYDADDSHYAQIVAGTITSNVDAITLGHDTVTIADNLSLGSDSAILKIGADGDATLTHDGTTGLTIAATPISIDSTGELHLNSTTGDIKLQDGGTDQITFDLDGTAGEVIMKPAVDSDDLVLSQYDGTEVIRIEDNASLGLVGNKLNIANSSSDVIVKPLTDAKDIIFQQYDGNEVMRINDSRKLQFYDDGGESITSDGSKLIIESGGTTFNLPSADGSDGQFLKTNGSGTLSFAAAGSDFVRLGEVGGSSSTAAVTFDNVFDGSTYQMYRLIGQISPAVNAHLYFKWRTGSSGSNATYTTSDYIWKMVGHYIDDGGNVGGYDVGGYPEAYFNLSNDMKTDSNSAMSAFDLYIADPDTNLFSRSMITGTVGWHENTGNQQVAAAFSARNSANVNATGLTLVMGSNNITWHRVQLWGYKRA
tara:strand:- start:555 stop:1856 length:1302 start_codon:yes stop_codon:yes gene_type:complete